MFSTAMMATDLSPVSDAVIRCAGAVRALGVKRIVLFHALGLRHLQDMAPLLRERVEPRLAEQAAALRAEGFEVSVEVVAGSPAGEIPAHCLPDDVSLIIMGATSDSAVREVLMGSVTTHVLHSARCPVLVLHLRPVEDSITDRCEIVCADLLGHIVFGTDFSDAAEQAFRLLERLARLGARQVTLLHVQDRGRIRGEDADRLEEFNEIDRRRLDRVRQVLIEAGVDEVNIEIPFGSPAQEVTRWGDREDVTLVLLGTQGRGFFGEPLLGGTAHQVARRASVPTLLVPPQALLSGEEG